MTITAAAAAPPAAIQDALAAAAALAAAQSSRESAITAALGFLTHFPTARDAWEAAERGRAGVSVALILQRRYSTAAEVAASLRRAAGIDSPMTGLPAARTHSIIDSR